METLKRNALQVAELLSGMSSVAVIEGAGRVKGVLSQQLITFHDTCYFSEENGETNMVNRPSWCKITDWVKQNVTRSIWQDAVMMADNFDR